MATTDKARSIDEDEELQLAADRELERERELDNDEVNDARAEQQMIEGSADTRENFERIERHRSLEQDEPDSELEALDPVPPK
jgi:hypothetical protein